MDIPSNIQWAIIAPILLLQSILMIVAIISCVRAEVTNGPKWLWILVIAFISIIGPVLYFVIGRRQN